MPRKFPARLVRWGLHKILPFPDRFWRLFRLDQLLRTLRSECLEVEVQVRQRPSPWPDPRRMLALRG